MPTALENFIDWGYSDGGTALAYLSSARNHLYYAADSIEAEDWIAAKGHLYDSADDFGLFDKYLLQDDVFYKGLRKDWRDALYYINDNAVFNGAAEIDMNAILDAMWASADWQTLVFISYVDAMRGSVSEKTVTEQSMANYLRHFLRL